MVDQYVSVLYRLNVRAYVQNYKKISLIEVGKNFILRFL